MRELTVEEARDIARRAFAKSCTMHGEHVIGRRGSGLTPCFRGYVWGVGYRYFQCQESMPLNDRDTEDLLEWIRRRIRTVSGIPSAVADQIASDLNLSQQQAAALCEASGGGS